MHDKQEIFITQLTPQGRGAVATLRIEGIGATEAVQALFHANNGRSLTEQPPQRLILGRFGSPPGEEIVARRCQDDAVELYCHGGLAAVHAIEQTLLAAGCQRMDWTDWIRLQEPDPVSVAALAALAQARTERTASILLDQYHGAFQHEMDRLRQAVADRQWDAVARQCDLMLERAALGKHLIEPWHIVLAGCPNVGKSSLINGLAGFQRAIVHATPGTTRDLVRVETVIDGWPVELCDTAGLRREGDLIEQTGIERALQQIAQADLVLLVFDRSQPWSPEDQAIYERWPKAIVVHNKCDLPGHSDARPTGVAISAKNGSGLQPLLETISRRLAPHPPSPGDAVPFTPEQTEAIRSIQAMGIVHLPTAPISPNRTTFSS